MLSLSFPIYVVGLGDAIKRTCNKFNIRVAFRSNTLKSTLMKVEDLLPTKEQANVVYQVPYDYGLVYIGKTKRRLETRIKEHKDTT